MRFAPLQTALGMTEEEVKELHDSYLADGGDHSTHAFLGWLVHQGAINDAMRGQLALSVPEADESAGGAEVPSADLVEAAPAVEPASAEEVAAPQADDLAPQADDLAPQADDLAEASVASNDPRPAEPSPEAPSEAAPAPAEAEPPPSDATSAPAESATTSPEAATPPAEAAPPSADPAETSAGEAARDPRMISLSALQAFVAQENEEANAEAPTAAISASALEALLAGPPPTPKAPTAPPPPPGVKTVEPAPGRESGPRRASTGRGARGTGPQAPADDGGKRPTGPQRIAAERAAGKAPTGPQKSSTGTPRAPTGPQKASTGSQRPGTGPQKPSNGNPGTGPQGNKRKLSIPAGSRLPEDAQVTAGTPDDIPGRAYRFTGKIGEGAMGKVLMAKDLDLHREVAYKVMAEEIKDNPELAGKFYTEAQITAQLDHPNVVPVYALARHPDGGLSYTMKKIRGRTFEKFIEESKELHRQKRTDIEHALESRLDMFLKVLDAMHYAHTRGVVHRDLKPENIMVGAFGEVYVMDWGIARLFDVDASKREELVLVEGYQEWEGPPPEESDDDDDDEIEGVIIGTPQYMSPEQAYGRRDIDGRSDQYALGLILFEIVALKQAVTGRTPQKIVLRQQDGGKEPLTHAFNEPIAPELRAIIEKATTKDTKGRYTDVRAMAEDIRRYLRGEAVLAKPDTLRQKVSRWVGKHREFTLLVVFAFFSMSAITVLSSVAYQVWSSAQARAREQAITQMVTQAGAQASLIDSYFARYEGNLGIVAASTVEMLIRGEPTEDQYFLADAFDDPARRPPGMDDSKRYGLPITVQYPVFFAKGGELTPEIEGEFRRLTPVIRYMRRAMLLSHSEDAASSTPKRAERMISDVGTPVAYVNLGFETGGFISYPGRGGIPANYDAKKQPWYKLAEGKKEPTWGMAYVEPHNLGQVLPCSMGLYDEQDKPKFLGVASIQLPFDFIIDKLLLTEGLPEGAESFLVDDEGNMIVRSSEKGKKVDPSALRTRAKRSEPFPVEAVVEGIKNRENGRVTVQDDLVLYNRMNALGWYYVIQGNEAALLEATGD